MSAYGDKLDAEPVKKTSRDVPIIETLKREDA